MPIARVGAPPSVAGEDSPEPPDPSARKAEHVAYATEELGYSEEAAQDMTKKELVEQEVRANREDMADELDQQNAEDEEAEAEAEGADDEADDDEEDEPSAGNSSSTSESKPEKSGGTRQATGRSTRSRAPGAASPSRERPQAPPK